MFIMASSAHQKATGKPSDIPDTYIRHPWLRLVGKNLRRQERHEGQGKTGAETPSGICNAAGRSEAIYTGSCSPAEAGLKIDTGSCGPAEAGVKIDTGSCGPAEAGVKIDTGSYVPAEA